MTDDKLPAIVMPLAEFIEALDLYGSDVSAWPVELAGRGLRCLAQTAEAEVERQRTATLEQALRAMPLLSVSADLRRRVAEVPARHPYVTANSGWLSRWRLWAPALVSLHLVGVFVGVQFGVSESPDEMTLGGATLRGSDEATLGDSAEAELDELAFADVDTDWEIE